MLSMLRNPSDVSGGNSASIFSPMNFKEQFDGLFSVGSETIENLPTIDQLAGAIL